MSIIIPVLAVPDLDERSKQLIRSENFARLNKSRTPGPGLKKNLTDCRGQAPGSIITYPITPYTTATGLDALEAERIIAKYDLAVNGGKKKRRRTKKKVIHSWDRAILSRKKHKKGYCKKYYKGKYGINKKGCKKDQKCKYVDMGSGGEWCYTKKRAYKKRRKRNLKKRTRRRRRKRRR
tara:strand:- start:2218 stop:2754 length:537 start_codon:yes stop_codon:yes gene_type:complete